MANYQSLKAAINAVIKANGNKEITGTVLNEVLLAMVNSLGAGYQFAGVATPSTNPGTPDQKVFYIAFEAGTYTNFNDTVLSAGISIFMWNGSWSSQTFYTIDATPTASSNNLVSSGAVFDAIKTDGSAYDVSAHFPTGGPNNDGKFTLEYILSNANTLIPTAWRKGGMSIRFVQSSDNKYVQFRNMNQNFTTDITQWQGVDDEPTAGSDNLVKSGGVFSTKLSDYAINDWTIGKKIMGDGTLVDDSSRAYIDFVKLNTNNKIIIVSKLSAGKLIAFYDSNKEFISAVNREGTLSLSIVTIPNNAVYARFGCDSIEVDKCFVFYKDKQYDIVSQLKVASDCLIPAKDIKELVFTNSIYTPYIYSDGNKWYNENRNKTNIIPCNQGDTFIYKLANTTTVYTIAALNSNYELIQEESLLGDETLMEGSYVVSNAKYLIFCNFNTYNSTPYVEKTDSLNKRIFNNSLLIKSIDVLKNLITTSNTLSGYYISENGIAAAIDVYKLTKIYLNEGDYFLSCLNTMNSRLLWKFNSDYSIGEEIIGIERNYRGIIHLASGCYAICGRMDDNNYTDNGFILASYTNINNIIQQQKNLRNLTNINEIGSSHNLLNVLETDKLISGYYIVYQFAVDEMAENASYSVYKMLPIKANTDYYLSADGDTAVGTAGAAFAFYDKNNVFLSKITADNKQFTTPANCAFISISFKHALSNIQLNEGTARGAYCDYTPSINSKNNIDEVVGANISAAAALVGKNSSILKQNSLSGGNSIVNNVFPSFIKNGQCLSVYAEFADGGFDEGLYIGMGYNSKTAAKGIKITATDIVIIRADIVTQATIPHGLTLSTYIKCSLAIFNGNINIDIMTLTGNFHYVYNDMQLDVSGYNIAGAPTLLAFGNSLFTNIVFTAGNITLKKPVWAFGDSYFHFYRQDRIMYWLNEWGYTNMLTDGYGGCNSNNAYNDLIKALQFGCPQYLVWALGMNDTFASWQRYYNEVKNICKEYNITLILCTIPVVKNPTYTGKQDMTDAVRASGYRYIDIYKAVGANSNGEWYGNGTANDYQAEDGVHPTIIGAKAIATQWLVDFPEIMQYK